MEQLYAWFMQHPVATGAAGIVIAFALGYINLDKMKMLGFTISQFVRKTLGKKVEEKGEDLIGAIYKGMKSDNPTDQK